MRDKVVLVKVCGSEDDNPCEACVLIDVCSQTEFPPDEFHCDDGCHWEVE
jgi:hypothetical protein